MENSESKAERGQGTLLKRYRRSIPVCAIHAIVELMMLFALLLALSGLGNSAFGYNYIRIGSGGMMIKEDELHIFIVICLIAVAGEWFSLSGMYKMCLSIFDDKITGSGITSWIIIMKTKEFGIKYEDIINVEVKMLNPRHNLIITTSTQTYKLNIANAGDAYAELRKIIDNRRS